jgi:hypothetical protein
MGDKERTEDQSTEDERPWAFFISIVVVVKNAVVFIRNEIAQLFMGMKGQGRAASA